MLEFATREQVRDGRLIDLFPDWQEELSPLYAIHPSRQYGAAKVRVFVDFVAELLAGVWVRVGNPWASEKDGKQWLTGPPLN
ncbi:hypothetical protein RFM98_17290 [Mesorhizobium sp. VK9D]|nr:hypothetical protein [Mesorhizobium sp. VK9D]MDX8454516.1 hypothetical protein [Mesorhizobium sp. VK9D]